MNCHEIENTLIERMDELLPDTRRAEFDAHLGVATAAP